MSVVFAQLAMSLDGYAAPEGMTMDHWDDPAYQEWGVKWGTLMAWLVGQDHFRRNLRFDGGGETGLVNDALLESAARTGAHILGRRMFDQGERSWPEEAPYHTPTFVLTHHAREPWERPGGTTFYFVTEGPERALELAREAAGGRDVRISGGADVVQQYLNLGALDEIEVALAPVLFGGGRRLFENLTGGVPAYRIERVIEHPSATLVRYVRT